MMVIRINYDINPYSFLDLVEDVYVVTSGMGFEALMAGKKVHCYGMPFYAGWGVTSDLFMIETRTRPRSVIDIFFFSYIELSRYFVPDVKSGSNIENLVAFFIEKQHAAC